MIPGDRALNAIQELCRYYGVVYDDKDLRNTLSRIINKAIEWSNE